MSPADITAEDLTRYCECICFYRKKDGNLLSDSTRFARLINLRTFYHWLYQQGYILSNITRFIALPRPQRRIMTDVLTLAEVEQVLEQPDLTTNLGIRDRALIEFLYSTGCRRSELVRLLVRDVHQSSQTVLIRQGKGKKDRIVPIGERALYWLERYHLDSRPALVCYPDSGFLFVGRRYGHPLTVSGITKLIRGYLNRSNITKKGCCHLFRRSMATSMLENGADIRIIQEILGHARLTTTERYTKVTIVDLKSVHARTHPFERI
jgi:integrase/recombinase XerD